MSHVLLSPAWVPTSEKGTSVRGHNTYARACTCRQTDEKRDTEWTDREADRKSVVDVSNA
eukprot:40762-Eustigmatos_ZCMA.PRE.1